MMNNNKKLFSAGIYTEGLRRLKMPGIVSAVLLSLGAILLPLVSILSKMEQNDVICESIYGINLNPFLEIVFVIIAPVLTWTILSFLNKRNASDFFHSLPHTRPCIFISSILAVLTWIVFIIFVSGGLSVLMTVIFSKYISLVAGSMIKYMLGCLSASILVIGAISAAMTITGRPFSNLVVSSLILFFPRFVISMITFAVGNRLPIVIGSLFGSLNIESLNIITTMVFGIFGFGSAPLSEVLTSTGPQIYSAVLGLIYIIAAVFLFLIRKSETAERSAPNRKLQAVYRICVCMTVCAVICSVIFSSIESIEIYEIVISYLIAVIVYFLYELATTRKWKNLVSAIPGLAIVAILNAAIYASMFGIYSTEIKFTPSANDIESVSIVVNNNGSINNQYDFSDFASLTTSDIKITDKDAVKAVSDALKENVSNLDGKDSYAYWSYYNRYNSSYLPYSLRIKADGKEKERLIYVTPEQEEIIIKAMLTSAEYTKAYTTLPKAEPGAIYFNNTPINDENELVSIYNTMTKEIAALPFETWYKRFNSNSENTAEPYDCITVTTVYDGSIYKVSIPLYSDIMPEATKAYINALTKSEFGSFDDLLSNKENIDAIYDVQAFIWDDINKCYIRPQYNYGYNLDFINDLQNIKADGNASYGDSFITLYVQTYDRETYKSNQYIIKLDENSRKKWEKLFESSDNTETEDKIIE